MAKDHRLIVGAANPANAVEPVINALGSDSAWRAGVSNEERLDQFFKTIVTTDLTHLHVWGHGSAYYGEHFIDITRPHQETEELFARYKAIPGIIHIWSCNGGAAKNAVSKLGEGRPALFHSGTAYKTLQAITSETILGLIKFGQRTEAQFGRKMDAYDAFEYSMMMWPETVNISVVKNGKVESFKGCAPKLSADIEKLGEYQQKQLEAFRKFRVEVLGHDKETFLKPELVLPTEEQLKHYQEQAAIMEIYRFKDRKDKQKGLGYIEAYLKAGVAPNLEFEGKSLLHLAYEEAGWGDLCELLVKHKAKINQPDKNGYTLLHTASEKGNWQDVYALVRSSADVTLQNNAGETALHMPVMPMSSTPLDFYMHKVLISTKLPMQAIPHSVLP